MCSSAHSSANQFTIREDVRIHYVVTVSYFFIVPQSLIQHLSVVYFGRVTDVWERSVMTQEIQSAMLQHLQTGCVKGRRITRAIEIIRCQTRIIFILLDLSTEGRTVEQCGRCARECNYAREHTHN